MSAAPRDFFKIERTASEIKAELLPRIFEVWATTRLQQVGMFETRMRFMDLQAGLERDEPAPAALQLLRQVYKSTGSRLDLNQGIKTVFYDADQPALAELQEQVEHLPFYQDLVHPPVMLLEESGEALAEQILEAGQPALAFLNPVEEGIAQQLLLHAVQTSASDLLMLFNPKTLEAAVKKAKPDSLFQKIFEERLEQIKGFYKQNRNADRREEYLLDCFEETFSRRGFYTLRFRINLPDKKQTGYYLVLASTSAQAYTRLKELLEGYSDYQEDGVPLFGVNLQAQQMSLFQEHYKYAVARLAQELSGDTTRCNNRSLQYIYEQHSLGTHYTLSNYAAAYERLMRQGLVRFINPKTGQPVTKLTATSLIRYSPRK
ncbi:hypothetical protein [Pontibacter amylolyticus]|uniref:Three-Cys-motif partner protein TcmP n=1 Tax=Pontibacter amylolyticus TaxID=1424080 RepID=A0ABQ1W070_9BACT|nr:hypothetical protein [Pontibacter amylolyticus]GGG07722.1 hypothetical protein GCM10011323_10370 [Pontibacter amylolyticus]